MPHETAHDRPQQQQVFQHLSAQHTSMLEASRLQAQGFRRKIEGFWLRAKGWRLKD